ncbi:inner membrane protein [Escherichia coli]|uniref:Inner membrane protein n=1 Tax=Escherichia coli TaxID=562 RepID=A0A376TEF3_ECOLX|nr:inner membrane protein [Escherichia coli]
MNAERKFLLACLIFALVIYAIHTFGLFDLLTDLPHLQTLIRQSGLFGYSLYILLFIIATLFLLPGSILVIAGGIVFGPLLGTLLSLIAATLASSCSFLLARWLGRDLLLKYVGHSHTFQAIEKGIARNGIDFLILTRLIPLFPYNIQNYAYGLTTITFWPYTLISALHDPARYCYLYRDGKPISPMKALRCALFYNSVWRAWRCLFSSSSQNSTPDTNMWICLLRAAPTYSPKK